MKKITVQITPHDDYIPEHLIELAFSNEQINIINTSAKVVAELGNKFIKEEYKDRECISVGIELNMPVAKWKGEKYSYTVNHTTIHVYAKSFIVSTITEGLHVLLKSDMITLDMLNR